MTKFSVVTSTHVWNSLREKQLIRCENSLVSQSYKDFEWILIDDGSEKELPVFLTNPVKQKHLERIIALEHGLSIATGEWIVFLDADDEFFSYTLEAISQMIEAYPDYKMFNYASYHVDRTYQSRVRDAFKPEVKNIGHAVFGGGNIVNGTFVFHRSVYEDLGGFPPHKKIEDPQNKRDFLYMTNPWDFSVAAQIEFPEIKPYFTASHPDHPNGLPKELGNPWGNDFYLFYKYTRKYHSNKLIFHY